MLLIIMRKKLYPYIFRKLRDRMYKEKICKDMAGEIIYKQR